MRYINSAQSFRVICDIVIDSEKEIFTYVRKDFSWNGATDDTIILLGAGLLWTNVTVPPQSTFEKISWCVIECCERKDYGIAYSRVLRPSDRLIYELSTNHTDFQYEFTRRMTMHQHGNEVHNDL